MNICEYPVLFIGSLLLASSRNNTGGDNDDDDDRNEEQQEEKIQQPGIACLSELSAVVGGVHGDIANRGVSTARLVWTQAVV